MTLADAGAAKPRRTSGGEAEPNEQSHFEESVGLEAWPLAGISCARLRHNEAESNVSIFH